MIKKQLPLLLLLVCALPLFILNMHNTHTPGGDDYAQYIKEAQNIAHGKPYYQSGYIFNPWNHIYSPPQYPPGFPLLLAAVVKIWGIEILPLCWFNSFIALCLLFSFFAFFRKYMGIFAAVCIALLITYSQILIDLKQLILADTSGLLFIMLYLIYRNTAALTRYRIVLLIFFATMAMLIRTQAIILLFAEALYAGFIFIKQYKATKKFSFSSLAPSLYIVAGSMALYLLVIKVVFHTPSSADSFYAGIFTANMQKGIPAVVRDNANFLFSSIHAFFHYDTNSGLRTAMVTIMENCGLAGCITGFIISVSKRPGYNDIFFVLMCVLMLFYPIHDARYFLPAIAIVYYYCYITLRTLVPGVTKVRPMYIGLLLTSACLITGFRYLKSTTQPTTGNVPEAADKQAFTWLSQHISDTDIIICERPRLLTLYTGRRCIVQAWQYPMAFNKKVFDSLGAKYLLVMNKSDDGYYKTYLPQFAHPADSTLIAPGYMLYRLH